jgi:hypothetical protein
MISRAEKKRRLERAGLVALPTGWVSQGFAERALEQVKNFRPDVAAILAQPPKPRGRPKKEMKP